MLNEPEPSAGPRRIVLFADSGESEHEALYRKAAGALAASGVETVVYCPHGADGALVSALRETPGAGVVLLSRTTMPTGTGVRTVAVASAAEAREEAVRLADGLIGLPSRLGPVTDLYLTWIRAGETGIEMPVGLLNHKKAFDVVRGFVGDVAGVGMGRTDHLIQFSDSIEDLIARVRKMAAA